LTEFDGLPTEFMKHHVERVSKHDQKAPNLKEILAGFFL
jgi:hypothetical protein